MEGMEQALATQSPAPAVGFPTTIEHAAEAHREILTRRRLGHSWRLIRTEMRLTFEQVLRLAYRVDDIIDEMSRRDDS